MPKMYFSSNPHKLKRNLVLYNIVFTEQAVSPVTPDGLVAEMAKRGFAIDRSDCARRIREWYDRGLVDVCDGGFVVHAS